MVRDLFPGMDGDLLRFYDRESGVIAYRMKGAQ